MYVVVDGRWNVVSKLLNAGLIGEKSLTSDKEEGSRIFSPSSSPVISRLVVVTGCCSFNCGLNLCSEQAVVVSILIEG